MKTTFKNQIKQLVFALTFCFIAMSNLYGQDQVTINGKVTDENQVPIPYVNVLVKGGEGSGATTDFDGNYQISAASDAVLVISSIGFKSQEVSVDGRTTVNVKLKEDVEALDEVIVVGYSSVEKKDLTAAVSSVSSSDIQNVHAGSTVSTSLAGKLPGVSFRMPDGRPGASANVQIRNMGNPLYVIDGVQQDVGQFNNLSPNDIESISVLKDGSAAIYGSRAANGVVVVTTKKGRKGARSTVNIDAYTGWQNWTRFPETVNDSYEYMLGKAEAEVNEFGSTAITAEELEKYRIGEAQGYQSFNWKDFIVKKNAPVTSFNVSASGGSEKINYYLSYTKLNQEAVFGDEWTFNRDNIQSNVDAQITNNLKVGVQINGRIEERKNPGIPGYDDYWQPRFAILRNRPFERPYANDNPEYLNDIGHNETNAGLHNFEVGGYYVDTWRVLQNNFTAEYDFGFIDGLKAKGMYSYFISDRVQNGHEYTYDAYTYDQENDEYTVTGGSTNPFRERTTHKKIQNVFQGSLNYNKVINDEHTLSAMFLIERIDINETNQYLHAVPGTNVLPLIYFSDMDQYDDSEYEEARIGYVGNFTYNYKDKYYINSSIRRDASWKFAPDKRVGIFPSISGGWRITEEPFIKDLVGDDFIVNDFKIRASYGVLGDDDIGIGSFDYLTGYNYGGTPVIIDGNPIVPSTDRGQPIDNLSWFESEITDIGVDFGLFDGKLTGTFDYFYRARSGLRGRKYDVLVPNELGYSLPDENVNSDAVYGSEASLSYYGNIGDLSIMVSGNASYTKTKFLESYKPRFGNSYDEYRNSSEGRYNNIFWGYTAIGQFESQEQIDNYPINNDGRGNTSMNPGDIMYKDVNGDGKIDGYDETPIGYNQTQPLINYGLSLSLGYKGFDFTADFSGNSGYSWNQNWESRRPFINEGALAEIFLDRWKREDPFDPNSEWTAGKYPGLRYNNGSHSNNWNSTFWLHNITSFRIRTMELGYSFPQVVLDKLRLQKLRLYVNGYNLYSFDNLEEYGVDPEVVDDNSLQYPQNRVINVGINLSI
ncbi:SusC/RagA family TonB-linked outer membrane protein [Galbibacter orientalis]|uniref:TonB-linked outer membrane protein, SusC/RagA family n=1 Tax=Galbibacter orientalis DSM 19592 TaxID=926559 RepID=I3C1D3_9FLAO|nr:TonB-dependent receptor [Galbibacter orientalis]EIJ37426.1 TonB-linked outer membrane protein, SusC/RagA family [Galbibacter orientalis DSM 19592]